MDTTGPEIWRQTDGKVDAFICAVGTGGTLAGVAAALTGRNPQIKIGLADPPGAALVQLLHQRRVEGGGVLHHRRHRSGPHHEEPRRRCGWIFRIRSPTTKPCRPCSICSCTKGCAWARSSGINVAGAVAAREAARPWPHHRHDAVRLRDALSIAPVQPGIPALERSASAGVARAHGAAVTTRSDGFRAAEAARHVPHALLRAKPAFVSDPARQRGRCTATRQPAPRAPESCRRPKILQQHPRPALTARRVAAARNRRPRLACALQAVRVPLPLPWRQE